MFGVDFGGSGGKVARILSLKNRLGMNIGNRFGSGIDFDGVRW
jgi:hypothetical protein